MNPQLDRLADEIKFDKEGGPVAVGFADALAAAAIAGSLPDSIEDVATSYQRVRNACEEQGHPELAHHAGLAGVVAQVMAAHPQADEIQRAQHNVLWISAMFASVVKRNGGTLTITREEMEACSGLGLYELAKENPDRVTFSLKEVQ